MGFEPQYSSTERILIVDDEAYNIKALKIILQGALKNLKYDEKFLDEYIDIASNGQQAVDQFLSTTDTENKYCLILMDCAMPVKDGYTASKEIRQICEQKQIDQPYIIACTGHSEEEFVQLAWDSGMDEILAKPANITSLQRILDQFIKFVF